MRLLRPLLVVWFLTLGHAALTQTATAQEPTAEPLPTLELLDLDGNATSLEAFRGDVLVVNFWATWCAPCRLEMPSLGRLQAHFEDAPVKVLAVSVDRGSVPADKLEAFMSEVEVDNLTVLRAPDFTIMQELEIPGLPATLLVDREGREVGRVLGIAEWDAPESIEAVDRLLARNQS